LITKGVGTLSRGEQRCFIASIESAAFGPKQALALRVKKQLVEFMREAFED
jgi:hypothetical protein